MPAESRRAEEIALPESQAEAMTLLREAAGTLPSAKSRLADCLLRGCPTPASDPTEARQLLRDAATAGDLSALMTLAGPTDATHADSDPSLPAPERYAWGQFLQRLSREGCFGAAQYSTWATSAVTATNTTAVARRESCASTTRAPLERPLNASATTGITGAPQPMTVHPPVEMPSTLARAPDAPAPRLNFAIAPWPGPRSRR